MADHSRLEGERVFCYQCENEWDRAHGGLQCPRCQSEFTEVLELPRTPEPRARTPPPIPPNHPFQDHRPWDDVDVPDPEEDDIRTYQWSTRRGNGTFSVTSRTIVSGGGRLNGRNNNQNIPPMPPFDNIFPFMTQPPGFFSQPQGFGGFMTIDQEGQMRGQTRGNMPEQQLGNLHEVLRALFGMVNPTEDRARGPNQGLDLGGLFGILGAPNGRAGDHVFTQEAFDQVMSQLMDQTQGSTAPPPASDEAIDALPKKPVTVEMMGNDGKVECSICMDEVELGTEVTTLPCDHWFHTECIKHWLQEHDTCPHCRKPISNNDAQPPERNSTRRQRSSTSRRPSSVSSPRAPPIGDGSRNNPYALADSPSAIREARQQYFSRQGDMNRELERSRSRRSSSAQEISRPSGGRQPSTASNSGGGPMNWVRSHMPFGS